MISHEQLRAGVATQLLTYCKHAEFPPPSPAMTDRFIGFVMEEMPDRIGGDRFTVPTEKDTQAVVDCMKRNFMHLLAELYEPKPEPEITDDMRMVARALVYQRPLNSEEISAAKRITAK